MESTGRRKVARFSGADRRRQSIDIDEFGGRVLSRRDAVKLAFAPAGILLASRWLPACSGGTAVGLDNGSDDGGKAPRLADGALEWATGGTGAMTGSYPDPFADGLGAACTLTCAATLGPCYAQTATRKDVTEGHDGLPTRLAFLIVDESCTPIKDATVDIWHAAPEGVYSGSDAAQMCTLGNQGALAARWFRGVQPADENGRVDFDTCFPGWYSGRTVHIHFTVRVGGVEYVTSQLFFDDSLVDDIVATQPVYSDRGARDTTNANDGVVSAAAAPDYSFRTERMADGAMLASKALVIRSSTATTLCAVPGGSMGPAIP